MTGQLSGCPKRLNLNCDPVKSGAEARPCFIEPQSPMTWEITLVYNGLFLIGRELSAHANSVLIHAIVKRRKEESKCGPLRAAFYCDSARSRSAEEAPLVDSLSSPWRRSSRSCVLLRHPVGLYQTSPVWLLPQHLSCHSTQPNYFSSYCKIPRDWRWNR